jgi:hypothetical protein
MGNIYANAKSVLVWLGRHSTDGDPWADIFRLPYWTRIWVIQEVLLAKTLLVLYRDRFVRWDEVVYASASAGSVGNNACYLIQMKSIWDQRVARSSSAGWFPLQYLLERFAHFGATDQRDKVYALLSLTDSNIQLEISYSKSTEQVAEDTIRALTEQHRSTGSTEPISRAGLKELIYRAMGLGSDCGADSNDSDDSERDEL